MTNRSRQVGADITHSARANAIKVSTSMKSGSINLHKSIPAEDSKAFDMKVLKRELET